MHKLPGRIAAVIVSTMLLFVVTTGASILWMTKALDLQALAQAQTQVQIARDNLLGRVRLITLDYAKWDAAESAMRAADLHWIFENIGSAAMIGQAFQLAVMWGGALETDHGWISDGGMDPRSGLFSGSMLSEVEGGLADSVPGGFDGIEFFGWYGGALYALGASHFEPVEHAATYPPEDRFAGQIILGTRISEEVVAGIADSILLRNASILDRAPIDRPSLALPGLDGQPVAYIAWSPPKPGTEMLLKLLPLLCLVVFAAALLSLSAMRLVRRSAQNLVIAEHRASTAARTDALTGLPNRAAFQDAIAAPARAEGRAILFLDLNDFKGVNDSLGHAAGDLVIVATARRVASIIGADDLLARIAGDEFVLLVTGPGARQKIEGLAKSINRAFERPFEVMGHRLAIQAAIGFAVQDSENMSGADLVRQADLAMYECKRLKARGPIAFSAMIEEASKNAFLVERALRQALSASPAELSVVYQPVVTADGEFRYAEALARWSSPVHGDVSPARFVAVAEKAGLVIELGRVILSHVLDDLAAHPDLKVSVNISVLQLAAPDFISDFAAELGRRSIDAGRIEVELTESALIRDRRQAHRHLQALQAAGFSTALDDFGTGYSSVAYLDQLSFDTLKIDRSFVSGVRLSPKRHALLRAMIQMAHGLDLRVVCEGAETAEDLRLLKELNCDLVQGYVIDRPLKMNDLAARWLSSGNGRAAA